MTTTNQSPQQPTPHPEAVEAALVYRPYCSRGEHCQDCKDIRQEIEQIIHKAYAPRIDKLENALREAKDIILKRAMACKHCDGSQQNNDGENYIDEACPECKADWVAFGNACAALNEQALGEEK